MNKVFIILFAVIGLICTGAALFADDAQHQWIMAAICAVVILPFWSEEKKYKQFNK